MVHLAARLIAHQHFTPAPLGQYLPWQLTATQAQWSRVPAQPSPMALVAALRSYNWQLWYSDLGVKYHDSEDPLILLQGSKFSHLSHSLSHSYLEKIYNHKL
jgi:hypothetical protein